MRPHTVELVEAEVLYVLLFHCKCVKVHLIYSVLFSFIPLLFSFSVPVRDFSVYNVRVVVMKEDKPVFDSDKYQSLFKNESGQVVRIMYYSLFLIIIFSECTSQRVVQ